MRYTTRVAFFAFAVARRLRFLGLEALALGRLCTWRFDPFREAKRRLPPNPARICLSVSFRLCGFRALVTRGVTISLFASLKGRFLFGFTSRYAPFQLRARRLAGRLLSVQRFLGPPGVDIEVGSIGRGRAVEVDTDCLGRGVKRGPSGSGQRGEVEYDCRSQIGGN